MVDIETLGTAPGSVIVQLGAVYFNWEGEMESSMFSRNVSIQSCLDVGLKVDESTLRFWYKETPNWLNNVQAIRTALQGLKTFAEKAESIWSHATFDIPMINTAARMSGIEDPIKYWKCRDIRTLTMLTGWKKPKDAPKDVKSHDATEDCMYQVGYCVQCYNKLKGGK